MIIYCDFDNPSNLSTSKFLPFEAGPLWWTFSFYQISVIWKTSNVYAFEYFFSSFFDKLVSEVPCLVKELPQGLVALPLVADFSGGDAAGAGADVGRAVLLTRVIQVAGLGSVQTVILSGHCRLT